ncbi:MAG: glycogen debranching enzyme GlgX, partial [Candidatus Omnitrophica bacterium]|nr:glycogen debranching enzyme GlgX [Candidatus Omnitrophota bacterium]
GRTLTEINERGDRITGDPLLILMNAHHEDVEFTLPRQDPDTRWERLLDTSETGNFTATAHLPATPYRLKSRTLVLFRLTSQKTG